MNSKTEQEEYVIDLVRAINEVTEEHGAGEIDKLSAVAAIGNAAERGEWYSVNEDTGE